MAHEASTAVRRPVATGGRVAALLAVALLSVLAGGAPAVAQTPRQQQWYLDRIGLPLPPSAVQGERVLIGMFLSSVNADHPELRGRVRPGKYVGSGGDIKDRPRSLDTANGRDIDTGLAGLVVAGGGAGLLGVAPHADVQPISGPVGEEKVSKALRWLVDQGVKVIDMSGGITVDETVTGFDGIRYALSKDVVVIIDARTADRLPASATTGVLVVGGVDQNGKRDGAPSFGSRVDLTAPGATLGLIGLTAEPQPGREYGPIATQGDKQASAIVAGVVALVRGKHPGLNAASVIDRLLRTARDAGPKGVDSTYGHGIVDAGAAVTAEVAPVTENPLGDPGQPGGESVLDRVGVATLVIACCGLIVAAAIAIGTLLLLRKRLRRSP